MKEQPWKNEDWFVSPYNFVPEITDNSNAPRRVLIHDTTLRDGEQQPGLAFGRDDRINIALLLDEAGVDRIEAGMPAVTREDKEAIRDIAQLGLSADIFAFSRCLRQDVDMALECGVSGIVLELPSSAHIIESAYKWPLGKAIDRASGAVRYAKEQGLYVTFFTIDATRAEWEFFESVLAAVKDDMDSLTLADTFGVCSPFATMEIVRRVRDVIEVPVEIHAHDDLGMATANSLAAVYAGARVVHVTVGGIGERCGNTSLEETVLALKLLADVETSVNPEKLYGLCKAVENISGVKIPPQKAVVGENVFRTESGIIAEWWYKTRESSPLEVFPYSWNLVGRDEPMIVLGKKSGKASVEEALKEVGKGSTDEQMVLKILEDVKRRSMRKKGALSIAEFESIVNSCS